VILLKVVLPPHLLSITVCSAIAPDPIVEELAQRRFRLESLCEEQSSVIIKEPRYQAVYERNLYYRLATTEDRWIQADVAC
jgi:hypothetical protein